MCRSVWNVPQAARAGTVLGAQTELGRGLSAPYSQAVCPPGSPSAHRSESLANSHTGAPRPPGVSVCTGFRTNGLDCLPGSVFLLALR